MIADSATSSADPVVLCVDDDPSTLSALRRVLGREPYQVVTTATPEEALKRVESGPVNLVISDQRMPGMNGSDLLEQVRRKSPSTIRVLLTGYPESGLVSYGLTRGVDWLITKPWSDGALRGALRQLLLEREDGAGRVAGAADGAGPRLIEEITRRLGFFPPLFEPAARVPALLRATWSEMKAAYLDAPFPALFKERLFAYLSRFCSTSYLLVAQACALRPLGMSGREILRLLEEPPPAKDVDLGPAPGASSSWPEPGSEAERGLFRRAVALYRGGAGAGRAREELGRFLGDEGYTRLQALLSFIGLCRSWSESRPEIGPEGDGRVRAHRAALEAQEPRLAAYFAAHAKRTPEKGAEEERDRLTRAQKLQAIGRLSAGIAHEISDPLGYILSNLTALKEYLAELRRLLRADVGEPDVEFLLEDFDQALEETRQGAERIREMAGGLRDFSRADEGGRVEADPREVLEDSLRICWNELKHKAEVTRDYGALPKLECHPGRLGQVFVNLLLNAAEAIEERGEIRVSTRVEGDRAVVRVRDTGRGIPEEALPRIFEPFFTTKPVGEGAGLGLHAAYEIVRAHGGEIDVTSKPGEGTEVSVRLPLAPADPASAPEPGDRKGGERP